MFSKYCRLTVFPVFLFMISPLSMADSAALQQQVEALQQRVDELERRLNALETPQVKHAVEQLTGSTNPGDSNDQSNWRLLKVGFDYHDVRELLGEPVRIKKGGMEFWYYSDRGLKGPYVKFLFKKANDWKAPGE